MNLFPRKPKPETLHDNALRFVDTVHSMAKDQRYILMYPHPGFHGRKGEQYNWIAMPNTQWRSLVYTLLGEGGMVRDATFAPPDSLDGWTFSAISIYPTPRVALLEMGDTL